PGQPLRSEQRAGAWQQDRLADRHLPCPRRPHDGDGPPPAAVGAVLTGEVVGDDPVTLALVTQVLAGLARPRQLLGCLASHVYGFGACLVGSCGAGPGTAHRPASAERCCSLTLSFSPMPVHAGAE